MNKETQKILESTLELLSQPDSWCQGHVEVINKNGGQQHCIIGALIACKPVMNSYKDALDRLCDAAELNWAEVREHRVGLHPLARWNDSLGTSQEDVILVIKKALYGA